MTKSLLPPALYCCNNIKLFELGTEGLSPPSFGTNEIIIVAVVGGVCIIVLPILIIPILIICVVMYKKKKSGQNIEKVDIEKVTLKESPPGSLNSNDIESAKGKLNQDKKTEAKRRRVEPDSTVEFDVGKRKATFRKQTKDETDANPTRAAMKNGNIPSKSGKEGGGKKPTPNAALGSAQNGSRSRPGKGLQNQSVSGSEKIKGPSQKQGDAKNQSVSGSNKKTVPSQKQSDTQNQSISGPEKKKGPSQKQSDAQNQSVSGSEKKKQKQTDPQNQTVSGLEKKTGPLHNQTDAGTRLNPTRPLSTSHYSNHSKNIGAKTSNSESARKGIGSGKVAPESKQERNRTTTTQPTNSSTNGQSGNLNKTPSRIDRPKRSAPAPPAPPTSSLPVSTGKKRTGRDPHHSLK